MLRWLGTVAILLLLALDLVLPATSVGRRGTDARVRADVATAAVQVGEKLPDFTLNDLDGAPLRLADLRGHRVLITFERSVDW
jgi:cytochrome oxidase Cu insertion factor (SCO1/SenC/PrrC family)